MSHPHLVILATFTNIKITEYQYKCNWCYLMTLCFIPT